jgi:hypothetical protein
MYDSESSSEAGWIEWFCDLEGHEFFVAVSTDYKQQGTSFITWLNRLIMPNFDNLF